jgi:ribonuclease D
MRSSLPPAQYIDHDRDLRRLADQLSSEPQIAFDTESNSLYAYRERVCLVQISTRQQDYILDPLRIGDMSPVGQLLADPRIEKVFHAAEYDLMCLKRDYGFTLANLFDTMVAARICGLKQVGLGRLLADFLGVEMDKSHQRDDWGQRPLTEDGLRYAQMDTHYLLPLRDRLANELERGERMTEAHETFAEATDVPAAEHGFDPDGYWKIGIPADLTRRQLAILRELYLLRERLAEERDCPPFKVFTDKVMIAIAEMNAVTVDHLGDLKGFGPSNARRYGRQIQAAVEQGRSGVLPRPPSRPPDIDPLVAERFTALRDWRRMRAEQRGVESDVIVSKDTLWGVAHKAPQTLDDLRGIEGLGPWRLQTYGAELLDVIQKTNPQP